MRKMRRVSSEATVRQASPAVNSDGNGVGGLSRDCPVEISEVRLFAGATTFWRTDHTLSLEDYLIIQSRGPRRSM